MAIRWVTGGGGGTVDAESVIDALADAAEAIDLNGQAITNVGNVDGADVSAMETKLDTIETSADVTDATNVAAAGAVMDGDFSSNGLCERTGAGAYSVLTAANHAAAHITGGSAAIQLATNSQPGLMSAAHVTALEAAGAVGPRIYPADSDDLLVWELQEAAGATTAVNTGTASSADLSFYNGTGASSFDGWGPFGRAWTNVHTGDTSTGDALYGAASATPNGAAVTISIWVRPHWAISGHGVYFGKAHAASAWADPYISLDIYHFTDGYLRVGANISGTGQTIVANTALATLAHVNIGEWAHVGATYDGTTVRMYKNGALVGTGAHSGTISWNTDGPWFIGSAYTSSYHNHGTGGQFRGARVANVVRSQTWFKDVYAYGIGEAA